jgi:hypothetical protein
MAAVATDATRSADDGREETRLERLDRNTIELVQEVRVAAVGIQYCWRSCWWCRSRPVGRTSPRSTATSISSRSRRSRSPRRSSSRPRSNHRILFREHEKAYVVEVGNTLVIFAAGFLTVGFTGIFVLLGHVLFGGVAATVAGAPTALATSAVWFGLPLSHRRKSRDRRL